MGRTSRERARVLRRRPEVGRLRAVGGLTSRVVVDGMSIAAWCERNSMPYDAVIGEVVDAAHAGGRIVVVLTAPSLRLLLAPPHVVLETSKPFVELLFSESFYVAREPLPSVVVADVPRDRAMLEALEAMSGLLDIATGRFWTRSDHLDLEGPPVGLANPESEALVEVLNLRIPRRDTDAVYVVARFHRHDDAVVLDRLGVEDGERRYAEGHAGALDLLDAVVREGRPLVMAAAMDLLGALYDAGRPLPRSVADPGLACVVLDPDEVVPPPGVGRAWRPLLSGEREDASRPPVDLLLDEFPALHRELVTALEDAQLLSVYENDVCPTVPVLVEIEREGLHVNTARLARDIDVVEKEMKSTYATIVSGVGARFFQNYDLVQTRRETLARLIRACDGDLEERLRLNAPYVERFAAFGNRRAQALQRLGTLHSVLGWMKKLDGKTRVRAVMTPGSTGRWYPREEALVTVPKRGPEARLLRAHLVAPPGHAFIGADYASIEPRLLAHLSEDPLLREGCQPGHDLYTHLLPILGVTDRDIAKEAVLAFMYGKTLRAFVRDLPFPAEEGAAIYTRLERSLTKALAFRKRVHEDARDEARTTGGWRRLRHASVQKFHRQAFNCLLQGYAADLFRKALRDLRRVLPSSVRIVHQAFDAVIVACPVDGVAEVEPMVKSTMENVVTLTVPLVVKTMRGTTLAEVT